MPAWATGPSPRVAVVMGSDSDLPVMQPAVCVLEEFRVPVRVCFLSAHRTPAETAEFARAALRQGIQVIIAGAGGAAHLAGSVAAIFPLPVIGVPLKMDALGGVDALYSTVQMPSGIPVATVGIDAAANAALLAIQILATRDTDLQRQLQRYRHNLSKRVHAKNEQLAEMGAHGYLTLFKTNPETSKSSGIKSQGAKHANT